jgi:hypothetical protein
MQLIGASKPLSFIGGLVIHSYARRESPPARGRFSLTPASALLSICPIWAYDAGRDGAPHNEKTIVAQGIGHRRVA